MVQNCGQPNDCTTPSENMPIEFWCANECYSNCLNMKWLQFQVFKNSVQRRVAPLYGRHIIPMVAIWVTSMRLGIKLPVTCHKARLGMMPFGRLKASGIKYFNSWSNSLFNVTSFEDMPCFQWPCPWLKSTSSLKSFEILNWGMLSKHPKATHLDLIALQASFSSRIGW